jgi:Tfp pilus assembly protein FimT
MRPSTKSQSGLSVLELLAVVAASMVLAAAALPATDRLQRTWNLISAARLLEQSLHWGRMYAVASNSAMMIEISPEGSRFSWRDPDSGEIYESSIRNLPGDVRIVGYPRRAVRFYPRGNAAPAGSFTLAGEAGSYRIVVSPGGRIRVEKN